MPVGHALPDGAHSFRQTPGAVEPAQTFPGAHSRVRLHELPVLPVPAGQTQANPPFAG